MSAFVIAAAVMLLMPVGEMKNTTEINSTEVDEMVRQEMRKAENPLPKRCKHLFDAPLLKYCDGLYPYNIIVKYNDHTVSEKEPFSIFYMKEEPNRYVVFFKGDEPHNCETVYIMDEFRVECGIERKVVKFGEPFMVCLNMHFEYVDDLAEYCTNRIDQEFAPSAFLALFYTKYSNNVRSAGLAKDKSISLRVLHPLLCIAMLVLEFI